MGEIKSADDLVGNRGVVVGEIGPAVVEAALTDKVLHVGREVEQG